MQATLSGITTCFKPWQQQNDWVPMLVRPVQLRNATCPMYVTPSGIDTLVSAAQQLCVSISSRHSRASACSGVSPGSIFPPMNSQCPPSDFPSFFSFF